MQLNTENTQELNDAFYEAVADELQKNLPKKNKYTAFSSIQSTNTQWIWYPFIPRGKIVLMTAPPGTGKTFLSLYLCAAVSDGRPFLGQDETALRPPETSIYQTAEDGISDTLKKRLELIKPAPRYENIFNIDESEQSISLSDVDRIEEALKDLHPALMIFDPIQAYLGADVDMHRANEIRPVMARIGVLAEKYNCTMLFIMHNSKMQQGNALYAALGSVDIPAISRSMFMLDKNPKDENQLVLCHVKSSLAKQGESVLFHIDNGNLVFDGLSDLKAEDIYCAKKSKRNKQSVELDETVELLNNLLDEHKGYVEISEIHKFQNQYGISKGTLYNAKKAAAVDSVTVGYLEKKTYWLSPEIDKEKFKKNRPADTFTLES